MSTIRFLADHDLNEHIVAGVHRLDPSVEFQHVRDFGLQERPDDEVLEYAHREQWLVVSHDVNTMTAAASRRLENNLGLCGLLMVPQSEPVRNVIESLLLIWSATELEDWTDQVVFLPL